MLYSSQNSDMGVSDLVSLGIYNLVKPNDKAFHFVSNTFNLSNVFIFKSTDMSCFYLNKVDLELFDNADLISVRT